MLKMYTFLKCEIYRWSCKENENDFGEDLSVRRGSSNTAAALASTIFAPKRTLVSRTCLITFHQLKKHNVVCNVFSYLEICILFLGDLFSKSYICHFKYINGRQVLLDLFDSSINWNTHVIWNIELITRIQIGGATIWDDSEWRIGSWIMIVHFNTILWYQN